MDDVPPPRDPERFLRVGGLVDRAKLTLAIHGEDLDPDEITRLLQCDPTSAHRRGDAHGRCPPWPRGGWRLSLKAEAPTAPEDLVHRLLARLPSDEHLWRDLRDRFQVRLSFGLFLEEWNREFVLSAEAVRLIGSLGVGIDFDIYATLRDQDDGDDLEN